MNNTIKMVLVGESNVGKTSLLFTKSSGILPEYTPTIFSDPIKIVNKDGQEYKIDYWDINGDYPKLRPLLYSNTNVFLICFSISSRDSFNKCETKWAPEITKFSPGVPIILVATKIDLRNSDDNDSNESDFIKYQEGIEMRDKIKASAYIECSSLLNRGANDLFDTISIIGNSEMQPINKNNDKKNKCTIC
ncbi:hypothetical protein ACTFIU_005308 [Dictyostelium citrinum]